MYLQSTKGREEVRSLIKEACPLHGTSQSNGGIEVCRALYLEFSRQKAGDPKMKDPSVITTGEESTCPDGSTLSACPPESEDVGMLPGLDDEEMVSVMTEKEDPRFLAMWDSIHCHTDHREFTSSLVSRSFPSWKTLFLVNAPTSRNTVVCHLICNSMSIVNCCNLCLVFHTVRFTRVIFPAVWKSPSGKYIAQVKASAESAKLERYLVAVTVDKRLGVLPVVKSEAN